MTEKHADLPDKHTLGDSWGLGWIRFGWDGHRLIGHDGNTIGQAAFLRLLPEQGLAVTLLTNGGNAHDLYEDLYREIFAEVAGVAMPPPLAPPAEPVDGRSSRRAPRQLRAGQLDHGGARDSRRRADRCAPRSPGRWPSSCPTRSTSYALHPVDSVRDLFVIREPGGADLGAGDLLRPADRRAVRALRRARDPEGRLMPTAPLVDRLWRRAARHARRSRSAGRVRVAVGRLSMRSRASAELVARIGTERLGVEPERIVIDGRTHLRWRLGDGPARVLLLGHHDTVWPLGTLGQASVRRRPTACCAGRAAST